MWVRSSRLHSWKAVSWRSSALPMRCSLLVQQVSGVNGGWERKGGRVACTAASRVNGSETGCSFEHAFTVITRRLHPRIASEMISRPIKPWQTFSLYFALFRSYSSSFHRECVGWRERARGGSRVRSIHVQPLPTAPAKVLSLFLVLFLHSLLLYLSFTHPLLLSSCTYTLDAPRFCGFFSTLLHLTPSLPPSLFLFLFLSLFFSFTWVNSFLLFNLPLVLSVSLVRFYFSLFLFFTFIARLVADPQTHARRSLTVYIAWNRTKSFHPSRERTRAKSVEVRRETWRKRACLVDDDDDDDDVDDEEEDDEKSNSEHVIPHCRTSTGSLPARPPHDQN